MIARCVDAHVTEDEDPRRSGCLKRVVEPLILLATWQESRRGGIAVDVDDYDVGIAVWEREICLAARVGNAVLALAMGELPEVVVAG